MTALRKWDSALCGLVLLVSFRALAGDVLLLKSQSIDVNNLALGGFRRAYSGKIEEEIELRNSESGKSEFSRKFSSLKPRLIVAVGPLAADIAREAKSVSVIFLMVSDPVRRGLAGDNIAGVSLDIPISTQFSKFKELLGPNLKTIGLIYNPGKSSAISKQVPLAAKDLDIEIIAVPVDSPDDLKTAFILINETIDALCVVPDETFFTRNSFMSLLTETNKRRLPFLTTLETFVIGGALGALIPDYTDIGRQGAELAKEIESGKKPAELGTVPPDKVNWVLNRKTAKSIDLTLPRRVLDSAKIY